VVAAKALTRQPRNAFAPRRRRLSTDQHESFLSSDGVRLTFVFMILTLYHSPHIPKSGSALGWGESVKSLVLIRGHGLRTENRNPRGAATLRSSYGSAL